MNVLKRLKVTKKTQKIPLLIHVEALKFSDSLFELLQVFTCKLSLHYLFGNVSAYMILLRLVNLFGHTLDDSMFRKNLDKIIADVLVVILKINFIFFFPKLC